MAKLDQHVTNALEQLGLDAARFDYSGETSLRGPCPKCGGGRRLLIFLNTGHDLRLGCDGCGWGGAARAIAPAYQWTGEQLVLKPGATKFEVDEAMLQVQTQGAVFVQDAHEKMSSADSQWWDSRGLDIEAQERWKLGSAMRPFFFRSLQRSEIVKTYTIPKVRDGLLMQVDFRLANPPKESDGKYRTLAKPVPPFYFSTRHFGHPFTDEPTFIVEGSIKAMVLSVFLGADTLGISGVDSWRSLMAEVPATGDAPIYVVLDPDAQEKSRSLALLLSDQTSRPVKSVVTPMKVDDLILTGGVSVADFWTLCRYARSGSMLGCRKAPAPMTAVTLQERPAGVTMEAPTHPTQGLNVAMGTTQP